VNPVPPTIAFTVSVEETAIGFEYTVPVVQPVEPLVAGEEPFVV
jgi:hypothetical protein